MRSKYFFLFFTAVLLAAVFQAKAQTVAAAKIGGKWGYINQLGEVVIPFKYDAIAERFEDGLVWARQNGRYGFLNNRGKWAIKPKFDTVIDFHRGRALVRTGSHWFLLDRKGKTVMECITFDPHKVLSIGKFHNGRALVATENGYGYISPNALWFVEPVYDIAHDFSGGLALVRLDGKYGFMDTMGTMVIPNVYDNAASFSEGKACVEKGGVFSLIDPGGKTVLELSHLEDVTTVSQGVAVIQDLGRWKVLAVAANTVRDLGFRYGLDSFYYVYSFKENIAPWIYLEKGKEEYRCGYIDLNLNVIKPYEFQWVKHFSHGLAAVKTEGKFGYINKKGDRVISNIYEEAMDFHSVGSMTE